MGGYVAPGVVGGKKRLKATPYPCHVYESTVVRKTATENGIRRALDYFCTFPLAHTSGRRAWSRAFRAGAPTTRGGFFPGPCARPLVHQFRPCRSPRAKEAGAGSKVSSGLGPPPADGAKLSTERIGDRLERIGPRRPRSTGRPPGFSRARASHRPPRRSTLPTGAGGSARWARLSRRPCWIEEARARSGSPEGHSRSAASQALQGQKAPPGGGGGF